MMLKEESKLSVPKAFESVNKIALIKRESEPNLFKMLNNLISALNMSLSITNPTTSFQALDIITTITEKYSHLSIEEIALAFKNGKSGKYGPTYNRLDVEIICGWIQSYTTDEEYFEYMENRHKKYNYQHITKHELTPESRKFFEDIIKRCEDLQKEEKQVKSTGHVIVERIDEDTFEKRLLVFLPGYSEEDLHGLLSHYTENNYKKGIELINNELKRRKI